MTRVIAGVTAGLVLLVAAGLATLAGALPTDDTSAPGGSCTLVASDGSPVDDVDMALDAEQLTNADVVVEAADRLGLPRRAAVIGVATALQESGLRVLNQSQSDRDSAGIFQQRPSQGWGSVAQVMDPVYAAQAFYQRLVQVPDWTRLPLTVAAQAVQRSGYPDAYAQWEHTASTLTTALAGDRGGVQVDCAPEAPALPASANGGGAGWPVEQMGPDGLTPRTRYLRDLITRGFSETNMGGWCPGGCTDGHVEGSDRYTGHAIDIMILPYTDPGRIADGDRIATWLTANAQQLAVKYVIWRARIWNPGEGWRRYNHPSGSNDPTLLHMDHIHASVW